MSWHSEEGKESMCLNVLIISTFCQCVSTSVDDTTIYFNEATLL